jgi:hypothetical protein
MKYRNLTYATLVLCFGFVLWTLAAKAQPQPPAPPQGTGAEEPFEKVAQVLNLSPQQRSQLQPILQAEGPKVRAISQDPNLSGAEKADKLKAIHKQTDPLVKSILNPTQYEQWQTIRKDEIEHIKGGG